MMQFSNPRIEEKMLTEDRISALPEDLLIRILRLIPTKDAVTTMVLSKSWRFIWTIVPTLVFEEIKDDNNIDYYICNDDHDDHSESNKSVWEFLNKSIELHKALVLEALCIYLGSQCPSDAAVVGKCVESAVRRDVRILKLKLGLSAEPTRLPKSLYSCKTLKTLTLSNNILVDFPSSSCLPSLITLELLYVTYTDEASLVMFLSSCPVLEGLVVLRRKHDNVAKFSVNVPSLQFFLYCNGQLAWGDDDVVDKCLVMDTPSLKRFGIVDFSGESWSVENMPCLEHASIGVDYFPDVYNFLTLFSSVLSLELYLTDEMIMWCSTIKFPRLTKYMIIPGDSDWMDSLVLLLENTPKLKTLIVDYETTRQPPNASLSWPCKNYYPDCLKSSLEKVDRLRRKRRRARIGGLHHIFCQNFKDGDNQS